MPPHVPIEAPTGTVAYGLRKGNKTKKIEKINRPVLKRGHQSKRVKLVHDVVREVAGFAPYERRCMEMLRISKDKRALKFCKVRLGTHARGKRKREELTQIIVSQRKAAAHKAAEKK